MLIRITQHSEGIEHYFESGQKKGRNATRDMLDQRVFLAGSLDAFSTAVNYTNRHKRWKAHYWHITASFAAENNDLDNATLTDITHDLLRYYYPTHDPDSLIVAAEAHRPKIQRDVNKTTGEINQRLLHFHLAISKLDTKTDNQVRMIPFNLKVDQAFQSYLANKYQLVDPATRKRPEPLTKADIIQRWQQDTLPLSKQSEVARIRKLLSEQLEQVNSIEAAIMQLKKFDYVLTVTYKIQKSGTRYIQVKTNLAQRAINLRGKGFERLEKLYYRNENDHSQPNNQNTTEQSELAEIIKKHTDWWVREESKRRPSKKIDYEALQRRYAYNFEPLLQEQSRYIVLYKNKIESATLKGYRLWEKQNHRFLFNNGLGIKIYDKPTLIVAEFPNDPAIRQEVVTLMLKIAITKGWNINTLIVTGSSVFKQEVFRQIEQLQGQALSDVSLDCVRSTEPPLKPLLLPRLNQIDQLLMEQQQKQIANLSKDKFAQLKTELNAQQVIAYAVQKFGLINRYYCVTEDNKIADLRLKSKPRNVVDFLVKTCNHSLTEALTILSPLFREQCEVSKLQLEQPFSALQAENHLDPEEDEDDDFRPR